MIERLKRLHKVAVKRNDRVAMYNIENRLLEIMGAAEWFKWLSIQ